MAVCTLDPEAMARHSSTRAAVPKPVKLTSFTAACCWGSLLVSNIAYLALDHLHWWHLAEVFLLAQALHDLLCVWSLGGMASRSELHNVHVA